MQKKKAFPEGQGRDKATGGVGRGRAVGGGGGERESARERERDGEIQDPGKGEMMGGKIHREDEVHYKIWGRERMGGGT